VVFREKLATYLKAVAAHQSFFQVYFNETGLVYESSGASADNVEVSLVRQVSGAEESNGEGCVIMTENAYVILLIKAMQRIFEQSEHLTNLLNKNGSSKGIKLSCMKK